MILTANEKSQLIEEIVAAYEDFKAAFTPFPEEQINQSSSGKWSAAQIVQHMILATTLPTNPAAAKADRPFDSHVETIKNIFLKFDYQMKTPAQMEPTLVTYHKADLVQRLEENKRSNLHFIESENLTIVNKEFPFGPLGYLTWFEWMKLIVFHLNRHARQLEQLKGPNGQQLI
jgi:hypothetical protein